ncbi:hypothetical protein DAPPUDRAFT_17386, partial [Daphnia pulex]
VMVLPMLPASNLFYPCGFVVAERLLYLPSRSGLRTLPNNAKMHYNYANVQKDDGRWETAIDHYRTAIELWPNYASALNNLGTVL